MSLASRFLRSKKQDLYEKIASHKILFTPYYLRLMTYDLQLLLCSYVIMSKKISYLKNNYGIYQGYFSY